MNRHLTPRCRPSLLELESRVVPAWWSVTAPLLAAGTPGDTAATHVGGLGLNPQYVPSGGAVSVWADTAADAAAEAITGTITVTISGQSIT